jgi:hypothetical protein
VASTFQYIKSVIGSNNPDGKFKEKTVYGCRDVINTLNETPTIGP